MATATKDKVEGDRKQNPPEPGKVKEGDLMAFLFYTKVQATHKNGEHLSVVNLDTDKPFEVIGSDLVQFGFSADQYAEEVTLSRTELIRDVFLTAGNRPFTVCFIKKDGTDRVLRGCLIQPDPIFGESLVRDFDQPIGDRFRKVAHKTVQYMIIDGIKYVVRK